MTFFFVFFFQMLVCALRALGWGSGSMGLIAGSTAINEGTSGGLIFVGVLMIIDGIAFGVLALADFYILTRVCKSRQTEDLHFHEFLIQYFRFIECIVVLVLHSLKPRPNLQLESCPMKP